MCVALQPNASVITANSADSGLRQPSSSSEQRLTKFSMRLMAALR